MNDHSTNNGQSGAAKWAGVIVTVVLASGAMTIQWGVVTTKLQQVEKRLDEFIGEAKSIRAQYAEMEHKLWYLEGRISALSAGSGAAPAAMPRGPAAGGGVP
jgi:hypothetical protein